MVLSEPFPGTEWPETPTSPPATAVLAQARVMHYAGWMSVLNAALLPVILVGLWSCTNNSQPAARTAVSQPSAVAGAPGSQQGSQLEPQLVSPRPQPKPVPQAPAERRWGYADQDPLNDGVVAPPELVPQCGMKLKSAGVSFRSSPIKSKQLLNGVATCGSEDAVTYEQGPTTLTFHPPPVVSCQLALALANFESLLQKLAKNHFGVGVRKVRQGGTYNCRKMARFQMVSEHSYANAIDLYGLTLDNGKRISVLQDYGSTGTPPTTPEARFLRELASTAYDDRLFSVVLTPFWDDLHRNHLHLDMARYQVDGSRSR